jgi:serine phosphatase RsbU (regulator of sigma subunit)
VGGDFYDFLRLEDGRVGFVIGDVSGKGMAAALVMANTQSVLRAVARRGNIAPGQVLAEANEVLYAYIPSNMFVTCFCGILNPESGRFTYANAGHNPPLRQHGGKAIDLRATGMPLGLMLGMYYEEKETVLLPGDGVLFYSDGLIEAHNQEREMLGSHRLRDLLKEHTPGAKHLTAYMVAELGRFTGEQWEQEDDITLVALQHRTASDRACAQRGRRLSPDTTRARSAPTSCVEYRFKEPGRNARERSNGADDDSAGQPEGGCGP